MKICPLVNFSKTLRCYNFLKNKQYWERHGGNYIPISDFWNYSDMREYQSEQSGVFDFANPPQYKERNVTWSFFKNQWNLEYEARHGENYNEDKEKQQLVEQLEQYAQTAQCLPLFFKTIDHDFKGSVSAYVERLYRKSLLSNAKELKRFLKSQSYKRIDKDMGAQMTLALMVYDYWLLHHHEIKPENAEKYVYIREK